MYGLVDCNNFYCSCERGFNPKLEGRPVIVLSNNDGCAIRAAMKQKHSGSAWPPAFIMSKFLDEHRVAVFSSNYTLYGDMSKRIMDSLGLFAPKIELC
jgi:DNA polymerase V